MFKKLTAAIIGLTMAASFVPVFAADKTAANIGEWENSYWTVGTGSTADANGVKTVTDLKKSGTASAKMFLEKKATGYEATLTQNVDFEEGSYYRIKGSIYYNGTSAQGFYKLLIGEHRIKFLKLLVTNTGEWTDFEEVFRYGYTGSNWETTDETYSKNVTFTMTGAGYVYLDDISVKKVTKNGDVYVDDGDELIKNGGFEEDYIVPNEVTALKAQAGNGSITLKWTNPEKLDKIKIYDGNGASIATLNSNVSEYLIDGLTNGTEYTYTVKTVNKLGMESTGVTVKGIPHPPYTLPNIIKDDDENRIIGITADMEYSFDNAVWQSYDASNPPALSGDVTVYVRFKSAYEGVTAPVQVLYFTANAASVSGITLDKAVILENTLTVSGKVDGGKDKKITLTAVKKGADRRSYDDILAVSQTTGAEEGAFSFIIPLADKRNGNLNDGRYIIYVDGKKAAELPFASSDTRGDKIAELLGSDAPVSVITSNQDVFETLGLYSTDFVTLSTSETNAALKAQLAGLAADDAEIVSKLRTAAANALLISAPKGADSEKMLTLLKHYASVAGLSYTVTDANGSNVITAEKTIAEGGEMLASILTYMSGKAQTSLDDVKKNYCGGAALYYINNATYGEITELIKTNKDYLSLASDDYNTYVSWMGDRAVAAAKAVVTSKNSNPFTSGTDIINAMKTGNAAASALVVVTPGNNSNNNAYYGGGGGGSSSSGKTFITVGDKTTETQTEPFGDLANAAWAKESIMKLYNRKIVSGYGDNTFAPEKTVTREEYVKILISAFDLYDEYAECDFADVANDAWYYKYIASAVKAGIVGGISETEFGTGRNITREDIAVLTYKCLQAAGVEFANAELDFSDGDTVAEYAKEAVAAMKDKGIISGYEDGSFKPKQTATRAEACRICAIALEITEGRTL